MRRTNIQKLIEDLEQVQMVLNRSIGNLGHSAGGIDTWIGSIGDYKKLVKAKLIIDSVMYRATHIKKTSTQVLKCRSSINH